MKKISEQQLLWFKRMRTDECTVNVPLSYGADHQSEIDVGHRRRWMKGIIFISISFLLFWYSFSPVWGNPNDDDPPKNVLIPIDELMNGEENGIKLPPSESSKQVPSDEQKQEEKQSPSNEEDVRLNQPNEEKKGGMNEKKVMNESHSNVETKKINPQQRKETTSTDNPHSPQIREKVNASSKIRTENGGTLPNTATPFGMLFLRGIALVLLGMGLRFMRRER